MMTSADDFTRASPRYWAATRHPFKEGSAFEVGADHPPLWPLGLLGLLAAVLLIAEIIQGGVL